MVDLLVIGAGVVGCAVAYRMAGYALDVTVVDEGSYPGGGATKANSAMLHSGLSTAPGSMRAQLVKGAREKVLEVCRELSVPVIEAAGLITVAFDEEEHQRLYPLLEDAQRLGLHGQLLTREETLALEPDLNPLLHSSFFTRDVSVVSPYELAIAMAEHAALGGVRWLLRHRVTAIRRVKDHLEVSFDNEPAIAARAVINAAGINADIIANMLEPCGFEQHARRGEYYLYDKNIPVTLRHVVSVPGSSKSKGMVLVPTPHNNILAGSSADDSDDRYCTETSQAMLDTIYSAVIAKLCPTLPRFGKVITTFAGNRAVADTGDFVIKQAESYPAFITVGGIQSPGLTSCLNIADYIISQYGSSLGELTPKDGEPLHLTHRLTITKQDVQQANTQIAQNPDYGEIICRCEGITKGDILDAIHGVIPCRTVDALRRKLRVGMGRCQGGFCLQRILMILSAELGVEPWQVEKDVDDSFYLIGTEERIP